MLCGPSGAGKSRWLLPAIADWLEGKPMLGLNKKSYPDTCAYISCDRPSSSTYELIERMGLKERLKEMPVYSLMDKDRDFDFAKIPPMVGSKPRVLWIEAFQVLVPGGELNRYWDVMDFFRKWNQLCDSNDYTPFGSCHSPKMRDGEGYSMHRDKIMGTAAWGAATEGIITIEYDQGGNIDCTGRTMTVLPRNGKPWQVPLDFDERGYIVLSRQDTLMADLILMQELGKQPVGAIITTQQVRTWARAKNISERSMFNWLAECKHLKPVKRGFYTHEPPELSEPDKIN